MNIDEKKNDTCHIFVLTKMTMILANDDPEKFYVNVTAVWLIYSNNNT